MRRMDNVAGETAAIIAGAAAVVGALVGALAGGLTEGVLERRRQKARAQAGARLLRSDLKSVAECLGLAEVSGLWELQWSGTTPSWQEYRDVLASFLEPPEWALVDKGVASLRRAQTEELKTQGQLDSQHDVIVLMEHVQSNIRIWINDAKAAFNALGPLARDGVFDESKDFGGVAAVGSFDPTKETAEEAKAALQPQAARRTTRGQ